MDTGSSWTWTKADECSSDSDSLTCMFTKEYFHPLSSTSFVDLNMKHSIKYGDNKIVEGSIVRDTFSFGPLPDANLDSSQSREIVGDNVRFMVQYGARNSERPFDGILGLSPRSESAGALVVEELYDGGAIKAKQFAVLQSPGPAF